MSTVFHRLWSKLGTTMKREVNESPTGVKQLDRARSVCCNQSLCHVRSGAAAKVLSRRHLAYTTVDANTLQPAVSYTHLTLPTILRV